MKIYVKISHKEAKSLTVNECDVMIRLIIIEVKIGYWYTYFFYT